jgi:hypothetical protein
MPIMSAFSGNAAFARQFDRGFRRARHHQMAHAVVAVDQRGRRRGALDLDVRPRIGRVQLQPLNVLRQPEHAVRVGADQVGFQHQFGDLGGVRCRHAGLHHGVVDETADRRRRRARYFGGRVHFAMPARTFSKLPWRMAVLSASEIFRPRTCDTQSIMAMS